MVRLIQIGLGDWGLNWATTIVPQIKTVEVVGYVARSQERAAAARMKLGNHVAPFFLSLDEAVKRTAPDGVLVFTTTDTHVELVKRALEFGCHVLVEKPFVPTVKEGRELVQMAAGRDLILMVNQNFRFFPAAQRAAGIVREGTLGGVAAVSIAFRRLLNYGSEERARRHHELPHPLLADLGIHHFDLMRMVLGREPISVYCAAPRASWSAFSDPDTAAAIVMFEGDIAVSWTGSWEARAHTAFSGEWYMQCQHGDFTWACRGDRDVTLDGDRVTVINDQETFRVEALAKDQRFGRAAVLETFAETVAGRKRPSFFPDGSDNLKSLALMEAAIRSYETGNVVKVSSGV
ncbi:MAG: Gfo/Idh/MocA family oxidoreductase [Mesorhizobium sp.]|uniref:Gfo/Idh/MocA family protein n=1 Tax=Mesorhizobium sp. TaxID=1871066 RepID=UPI000FE7A9CA|nr:Gfo/Idh/MocA family oxidoreductase [Mesorhizobium sp.]RWO23567.1 MAG: Gfo/Idh/MocA family oxidoreductase [Mesorhizobium sp.]